MPTSEAMHLRPADELGGVLTSRNRAAVMRAAIENAIANGDHVIVDFAGVQTMSPSFADELVAKLSAAANAGQVEFRNIPASVRPLLDFVVSGRATA